METKLVSPSSLYWSTFNFCTFDFWVQDLVLVFWTNLAQVWLPGVHYAQSPVMILSTLITSTPKDQQLETEPRCECTFLETLFISDKFIPFSMYFLA